jgi:uncharacterized membrane protein SpoIIM required for sporulation
MNVDAFVTDRSPSWNRLEQLAGQARRNPERLGPEGVRDLGLRYRETVADLAYARRRFAGDPIVRRLEALVAQARHLVYHSESRTGALREFVSHGYWRRVRERPVPLLVAVLFLFVPALLAGTWAWRDPGAASGLVPSQYQRVTEPRPSGTNLGVSVSDEAALASQIFTNNITVTMLAFGGGLLLGLGTILVLLQNGVLLGAVAGLSIGAGNGRPFFALVTAHGVLELSCICVSAAAGLRIGWAIVDPGYRRRGDALRTETRAAVEMLLGTAPWLVVAGLVEGFVTPAGLPLAVVVSVGLGLGAIYWGLVLWRGAARPDVGAETDSDVIGL